MTTKEVRQALVSYPIGTKFTHPAFTDNEYLYMDKDYKIRTEDGYEVIEEFWDIREDWTGWHVKKETSTISSIQEEYPYYLHNYADIPDNYNPQYCHQCKLLKDDHTCPYSKKPIKLIHSTGCKFYQKK